MAYEQTKDSNYIKDVPNFDFKTAMDSTAPGAIQGKDIPSAAPSMGTTAPAGKSTEPGPFKYRHSTTTAVRQAEEVPDAKFVAQGIQEGQNRSKMMKVTPPEGDKEEPDDFSELKNPAKKF